MFGLCPAETCDKWTFTVTLMRGVGIEGPAGLDVRATLTADKNCCMKDHSKYYRYLGYGLGVGAEWSVNFKVGSHTFIEFRINNGYEFTHSKSIPV